jgi:hypothetical protein
LSLNPKPLLSWKFLEGTICIRFLQNKEPFHIMCLISSEIQSQPSILSDKFYWILKLGKDFRWGWFWGIWVPH